MAPLTKDPNAPTIHGETPIYVAACNGHTEIVNILVPLTENPNTSDIYGETPINFTQNKEILSILKPYKNSAKRTRISEDWCYKVTVKSVKAFQKISQFV